MALFSTLSLFDPFYLPTVNISNQIKEQVAQLSQRDRAMHELFRFAKLRSGIFEPPFWGLRGNIDASCVRRWKKRGRLPIGDN